MFVGTGRSTGGLHDATYLPADQLRRAHRRCVARGLLRGRGPAVSRWPGRRSWHREWSIPAVPADARDSESVSRRLVIAIASIAALLAGLALPGNPAAARVAGHASLHVGRLVVHRCAVAPRALCGSVPRPWDPHDRRSGTIKVGFAFVPARTASRPALGTVVPHEGGPGYSTTGTTASYIDMYGHLLDRRNLLLVDQRGTGRSEPVSCPALQNLTGPYAPAAAVPPAGPARRRLHNGPLRGRPRRDHPAARRRSGRPVRRLVRHVLRAGVRRPPR